MKRPALVWALTAVALVGLGYDAWVHLHLADEYDAIGDTITQGALFRVEAAAAVVAALLLVARDSRIAWLVAGLVGFGGAGAVLLYRYVEVPSIGPIPGMYEPVWYPDKTRSFWLELLVGVVFLVREGLRHRPASQRT